MDHLRLKARAAMGTPTAFWETKHAEGTCRSGHAVLRSTVDHASRPLGTKILTCECTCRTESTTSKPTPPKQDVQAHLVSGLQALYEVHGALDPTKLKDSTKVILQEACKECMLV